MKMMIDHRRRGIEISNLRRNFDCLVKQHHQRFLKSLQAAELSSMPPPVFDGDRLTFDCFGTVVGASPRTVRVDSDFEIEYRFTVKIEGDDQSIATIEVVRLYVNNSGGVAMGIHDTERVANVQDEALAWYVGFYVVEGFLSSNILEPFQISSGKIAKTL